MCTWPPPPPSPVPARLHHPSCIYYGLQGHSDETINISAMMREDSCNFFSSPFSLSLFFVVSPSVLLSWQRFSVYADQRGVDLGNGVGEETDEVLCAAYPLNTHTPSRCLLSLLRPD